MLQSIVADCLTMPPYFLMRSFGTATFIAITALEETGKAHVSIYRRDKPEFSQRGRDLCTTIKPNTVWRYCRPCS